ncbi:MAG: Gfo/Idh/MocA family oxidoreductase [Candidatus Omnitrophica bacterium]|nr:Gfo/Idh/MocA family oxidoreductase [Candidatus Omnitrophota bacterium]
MHKIRVAVIGTGYLGSLHAKLYKELDGCSLAAVCDVDPDRLEHVCRTLQVPGVVDYRDLFGTVDAVSICVPTIRHFAVAREFLARGIHCLVEKPFTATLREADQLITLARRKKAVLAVGHIERFNSAFAACRQYFKQPYFIECHRLSPFPHRSLDVGVVLDLMIHDIDICLGLVGSAVKRIDAIGVNVLTPFEDIANARLHFANGCVANITASRVSDEVVRKIRMFLKNAYISLDYKNQHAFLYKKDPAGGIVKVALPIEKEQPLAKELASFLESVAHHTTPLVSGEVAREALGTALSIRDQIWKKLKRF